MGFASGPRAIDEWKISLLAPCPKGALPTAWLYWAAEHVFTGAATNRTPLDLGDIVEAYKESCPHVRGLVPMVLMSVGLMLIWNTYHSQPLPPYEGIAKILKTLPHSDDGEVLHDWLLGTRRWLLAWGKEPKEDIGELLAVFAEDMERLVEGGELERDATYERAINFVRELRERRDARQDFRV